METTKSVAATPRKKVKVERVNEEEDVVVEKKVTVKRTKKPKAEEKVPKDAEGDKKGWAMTVPGSKGAVEEGVVEHPLADQFFADLNKGHVKLFLGREAARTIDEDPNHPMGDGLPLPMNCRMYGSLMYFPMVWREVLQSFAKKSFKSSVIEIVEATHGKAGKTVVFNFRGTKYFADRLVGQPPVCTLCTLSER